METFTNARPNQAVSRNYAMIGSGSYNTAAQVRLKVIREDDVMEYEQEFALVPVRNKRGRTTGFHQCDIIDGKVMDPVYGLVSGRASVYQIIEPILETGKTLTLHTSNHGRDSETKVFRIVDIDVVWDD